MTTTQLYQQALDSIGKDGNRWGAARCEIGANGVMICSVKPVAGCSIVEKHYRTTWHHIAPGQQYSKTVSAKRARELMGEGH